MWIISWMLTKAPVVSARIANNTKNTFFIRIQFPTPKSSGYRNTVSIIAGTIRPFWKKPKIVRKWKNRKNFNRNSKYSPKLEKKTAPTNPMNASNFGTAAAIAPRMIIVPPRIKICAMLCLSFGILGAILRQKMSIGM